MRIVDADSDRPRITLHDSDDLLNRYSDDALQRVWQSTYFSWWMTSMLHTPAANDPDADFLRQMQLTQLRYVTGSRAAMETVAENYTGKSMDGIEGLLARKLARQGRPGARRGR